MRSFTELLPEVSTPDELREVMRDLVDRGSRNWTYQAAAQYLAPELWKELTRYFDALTGRPRWPDVHWGGAVTPGSQVADRSLSALIFNFHDKLATISLPGVNSAERWSDATTAAPSVISQQAHSQNVFSAFPTEVGCSDEHAASETNTEAESLTASPVVAHYCQICERPRNSELVSFRGKPMCIDCAALLRGY